MAQETVVINFDGEWNGCNYIGGESIMCGVQKNSSFSSLVDVVYREAAIDRRRWEIRIYYLLQSTTNGQVKKIRIMSDLGVVGLMAIKNIDVKEIYIDKIARDFGAGVSRRTVRPFVTDSIPGIRHDEANTDRPVNPHMVENHFYLTSGIGSNQVDTSITPFTSVESPIRDVNDDYTNYGIDDEDEDTDDNGDGIQDSDEEQTGDSDEEETRFDDVAEEEEFPEIRFSGLQFQNNPSQPYWIVPGVELGDIEASSSATSTVYQRGTLYKGAFFTSKEEMTIAIGEYALKAKFEYRVRRSDTERFEAGCKDKTCSFSVRARCRKGCSMWFVLNYVAEHTCRQTAMESHMKSVKAIVIGKLYAGKVGRDLYTPNRLVGEMLEQYGVQILYSKAWKALQYAKKLAYGQADESYQQLPSYFEMLKLSNPGTMTAIKTDENNRFLYSFVALGASIEGFRSYMRPVVAIDATHLKGEYKGVIFFAACKDGSEMIYPIAFGFADGESDNSWTWFLKRLRRAIGVSDELVIVSDRHKSISNGMKAAFPEVPHVLCFFHLWQNLKQQCKKRSDVENAFYNAAYCYVPDECNRILEEMRALHPATHGALVKAGVSRWSRAHCPRRRYEMMTTNIAESLNNCMMQARRLPITTAHEYVRNVLQRWFNNRRVAAEKLTTYVTTAAYDRIILAKDLSTEGSVYPIAEPYHYSVIHYSKGDGMVDIQQHTCTCKQWNLDQLPCVHACAVARYGNYTLYFLVFHVIA